MTGYSGATEPAETVPPSRTRERITWIVATSVLLLTALGLAAMMLLRSSPTDSRAYHASVLPPPGANVVADPALSPDGRQLAFIAGTGRNLELHVRALGIPTVRSLGPQNSETDGTPFWSPDSCFLAFFQQGKLKKFDVSGGSPVTVAEAIGFTGAWNRDDEIVITSRDYRLYRVSASGGVPSLLSLSEAGPVEVEFSMISAFLPDGRHFLYQHAIRAD